MARQPHSADMAQAMHHLAVAVAEMDAAIARRLHLSAVDYLALKHVAAATEPFGPAELGRLLGMTSGAATGLVDRLEQAGHLRREPHPDDRRRKILTITAGAENALGDALRPLVEDIDRFDVDVEPGQRDLVIDALVRLAGLHRRHARA